MKRALTIFAALLSALLFAACGGGGVPAPAPGGSGSSGKEPEELSPPPAKAKVILLAGEGNCIGNTYSYFLTDKQEPSRRVTDEKYAEYEEGYDNVLISYRNEVYPGNANSRSRGFVPVKLGQGKSTLSGYENGMFGPEVGLAEYFSNRFGQTTYLVKYGGEGLSRLAVEWSPSGGGYYTGMVSYFREALASLEEEGVPFEIPAFLFLQGESDASGDLQTYGTALEAFSTAVRAEFAEYAPKNGIAFIDAGIPTYHRNSDKIDALKRENAQADERNYFLDSVRAGLTHDRDSRNRRYWDALSELKLGNLLGKLVQESLPYRLDCTTLRGEGEMPASPADGYPLLACADGQVARSEWNFSEEDGKLSFEAYVRDGAVTAGDGAELTVAAAARERELADGTVRFTVFADGSTSFSVKDGETFAARPSPADGSAERYRGGYVIRATLPKSALPAGDLSVSFALLNRNASLHREAYRALGTDPARAYTYMRIDEETLSAGYAQLGETFGDGGTLLAKDVWDLSADDGTEERHVGMTGVNGDNELYFYQSNAAYLFAYAELRAADVLNGERWGKFGIKLTTEENAGLFFYVDAYGNGTSMSGCKLGYATFKNGVWNNDWTTFDVTPIRSSSEYTEGTVRLSVRRERDRYYFYCNGTQVGTLEDPAAIGETKAYFALASFNILLYARAYGIEEIGAE